MVFLLLSVVFCVLTSATGTESVESIVPKEGWRFPGTDMVFRVEDTEAENVSYLDRIALRVDYGNVGVNAVPNAQRNGLELEFYVKEQAEEGRGKKMGRMTIPFIIGAMKAGAMAVMTVGLKALAVKALFLSKAALFITMYFLLKKLYKHEETPYVEYEHVGSEQIPVYDFGTSGYANRDSYIPGYEYSYFSPSAAESQLHYATLTAPSGNESSIVGQSQQHQVAPAAKRRDYARRKAASSSSSSSRPVLVMVKKITETTKGLV